MRTFRYSILVTILCLGLSALWGYHVGGFGGIWPAVSIAAILGVMEVSLSFDNAVVNASVLKEMDAKWRQIFLTLGILVSDAFMRVVNKDNDIELARFDLSEDFSTETARIFGEIYRHHGEWKFKAVGQGFAGGLEAMCTNFGVQAA